MNEPAVPVSALWLLLFYGGAAAILVAGMMITSYLLGPRRSHRASDPYESGIVATGSARLRLSVKFYLVAVFFVIFDLEAVFLFAWAVVVREAGWIGFGEMVVFLGVLGAALVYLWREGTLDWTASSRRAVASGRLSDD